MRGLQCDRTIESELNAVARYMAGTGAVAQVRIPGYKVQKCLTSIHWPPRWSSSSGLQPTHT